jgi:hypothetical protein
MAADKGTRGQIVEDSLKTKDVKVVPLLEDL